MSTTTSITPKASEAPEVLDTRTAAQIESDIGATQQRLASNVSDLQAYVAPKAVAQRQVARVRNFYVDEFGGIRVDRVAATVVAVGGALLLRRLIRRR